MKGGKEYVINIILYINSSINSNGSRDTWNSRFNILSNTWRSSRCRSISIRKELNMITTAIILGICLVIVVAIAAAVAFAAINAIIGLIIPIVVIIGIIIALMVIFGIIGAVLKYKKHKDTVETIKEVKASKHRGGDTNACRGNSNNSRSGKHQETTEDGEDKPSDSVCAKGERVLDKFRR